MIVIVTFCVWTLYLSKYKSVSTRENWVRCDVISSSVSWQSYTTEHKNTLYATVS